MNNEIELQREIESLKKSPLFNLSLASKELFHSNFLAWFIENNREETVQFFRDKFPHFQLRELTGVDREKKHIDITIDFNDGYKILIENKVKSLPIKSQLDGYCANLNRDREVLILLSLYPDEYKPFLSYGEVLNWMEGINKQLANSELEELKRDFYITKDYIDFTRNLLAISRLLMQNDSIFNFHSRSDLYREFYSVRLHDIFHKIKYKGINELVSKIISKWLVEELGVPQEDHYKLYSPYDYFSRGTAAVNFNIPINGDPKFRKYFEIQFQDNMLRFMLFSNKCVSRQNDIHSIELFKGYFGFSQISSPLFTIPNMANNFNKYGDYIIYKYLLVNENCCMDELIHVIVDFIQQTILNVNQKQQAIDEFLDAPQTTNDNLSWSTFSDSCTSNVVI